MPFSEGVKKFRMLSVLADEDFDIMQKTGKFIKQV